jgi:nitrite reductase/ring-hydroxylating ferredoxin subunit
MQSTILILVLLEGAAALRAGPLFRGATHTVARSPAVQAVDRTKKIPSKNVWVSFADAKDAKPGQITSGFQYGLEIAIVTDKSGATYACSNKLPPTGQPATFCELTDKPGQIKEPISGTVYSLKSGQIVGDWCPSILGRLLIGRLLGPQNLDVFPCRKGSGSVQVLVNVNAKAQFEQKYWRGILDAQGKVDGGYY